MALLLLLTGCYENFEPDVSTKPVLCMNSIITAGEPIEVEVTHTWRFDNPGGSKDRDVKDAIVSIYANGRLVSSDYIPQEGDRIRLIADSRTYGEAEAEVTVPLKPCVSALEYTPSLIDSWWDANEEYMNGGVSLNLSVSMKVEDKQPTQPDYYQLRFSCFYETGWNGDSDILGAPGPSLSYLHEGTFQYQSEPIFSEHIGEFDSVTGADAEGFTFFTDRQFSGRSYPLHLNFSGMRYSVQSAKYDSSLYDCGINFRLFSVSPSYYSFALYTWQIGNGIIGELGDVGFGDPIWGYSNVSTGAGLVAARTEAIYNVNLKDFIQQAINQTISTK